jgi:hypothetical protein
VRLLMRWTELGTQSAIALGRGAPAGDDSPRRDSTPALLCDGPLTPRPIQADLRVYSRAQRHYPPARSNGPEPWPSEFGEASYLVQVNEPS